MKKRSRRKTIGMVGIGGSGMRGLAYLLYCTGDNVIGTDAQIVPGKEAVTNEPYALLTEEQFDQRLQACDQVVFSDAVAGDHDWRRRANEYETAVSYQAAVGNFARRYRTVAITGTHGKSSTTAMTAHIMIEAGLDPTVLLGAAVPKWGGRHARLGQSDIFVVEADEYREHFLTLTPTIIAITSVDYDHPDYFASLKQTESAYSRFIANRVEGGEVLTLQSIKEAHPGIAWPADTIVLDENEAARLAMNVPGWHMKTNGLIAMKVAALAGVDESRTADWLKTYEGIRRRFERLGKWRGLEIVSDYGHHPTEIARTMRAAREEYQNEKIVVLLEPHTMERVKKFGPAFRQALKEADGVILAPIFTPAGREQVDDDEYRQLTSKLKLMIGEQNKLVDEIRDIKETTTVMKKAALGYDLAIAFTAGKLDLELRNLFNGK